MLGTRHPFVFMAVLLAMLALSPKAGSAQANEAPVPSTAPPTWTLPGWEGPGGEPPIYGSTTAPTSNPWVVPWAPSGPLGNSAPSCTGIACLTAAEKSELNELCKLAGAEWQDYDLCKHIAFTLLVPRP